MKRRNERQKGFTLIELLVVLIVIAVLAAVLVPALTSYLDDAREKKAVSEAQVCVTAATEWAAVQRTALISQAYKGNQTFADAYKAEGNTAKWSTTYEALSTAAPTVTGTPALAEGDGQYFLRPEPAPDTDTTTDTMKNTVKAAAGVDGKLEKLQLNADGKVLYLLYTSAEGITVAYTAAGTAQTPDTTVPVATLPEDTTPTPPTPSHSGDLVFCVLNEYTGNAVPGIAFRLVDNTTGTQVSTPQTTDDKGMVYFDLDVSSWDPNSSNCKYFTLHPESWPEGYQQVFDVRFSISAEKKDGSQTYNSYRINGIEEDINEKTAKYKKGEISTLPGGAKDHLYTFYARTVPTLQLRVLDENTQTHVSGVTFTMKQGTITKTITSGMKDTVFYVQLHDGDHLPSGCESIDFSSGNFFNDWSVNCTSVPEGYQNFEPFYLKTLLENRGEHNNQLYTESRSQVGGSTNTTCTNDYEHNRYIVTIPVQGGKDVNFFVYDGLDNVHTTQLPNAKLQLCKQNGTEIATFTTDANGKPIGTGSFTETLPVGDYTLKLASNAPDGYTQPTDIPFKVELGADGLLTLTGDTAYVDNDKSTVTMLVTKPNTKRIQLQVVDAITKEPWAGVNVKVTGKCLKATKDEERNYKIDSLAKNTHTLDLDLLDEGDITVTIVGSDNKDSEFKDRYHDGSYINNFVGSKFVFNLKKNTDGTVTLTKTTDKEGFNGDISPDGSTVYVYAYPRLLVDFQCSNASSYSPSPGQAVIKASLQIYNTDETPASTKDGNTIQEWEVKKGNHDHPVGLSTGDYKLHETEKIGPLFRRKNLPLSFTIGQTENGFPALMDSSGKIVDNEAFSNNPLKITALYEYVLNP